MHHAAVPGPCVKHCFLSEGQRELSLSRVLGDCVKRTIHVFQELNRLRKAALAFGFLDLLKGVADMLERECTLLPDTAHPDAAFQLTHAAQQLKLASTEYAIYDHNITPLHTDFSGSSTERM